MKSEKNPKSKYNFKVHLYDNEVEKKLDISMANMSYGKHRNAFNIFIESLRPLDSGHGGILLLPFIEKYFIWGKDEGEALSEKPMSLNRDWIGIIHIPFDSPSWLAGNMMPEKFMATKLWEDSFPACKGLICLCQDLEADVRFIYPDLPLIALKFPTVTTPKLFDFDEYQKNPRLVQVGEWLRKLQAIYEIQSTGHEKIILLKSSSRKSLAKDISKNGDFTNNTVKEMKFVSDESYDQILSSSVVICFLYATAANNIVVECISRHTPIIINPLPAVVEYLGDEYPLYATDSESADELLADKDKLLLAVDYLRRRTSIIDLSYRNFYKTFASSKFYKNL
jgi:hypothetical protein